MVADTDSNVGDLVVPTWAGVAIGAVAGLALTHLAGIPVAQAPLAIAGFALLGWFYALCQHRTTVLGFLFIGFFMGINCWILTKILIIPFDLDAKWALAREHATSFKHCILFGEILAISALLLSFMQGSKAEATFPKD